MQMTVTVSHLAATLAVFMSHTRVGWSALPLAMM